MAATLTQPLYEVFDNTLTSDFCQKVIDKFELDDRAAPGLTNDGLKPGVKQSQDLHFTYYPDWKEYDDVFYKALTGHTPAFYSNSFLQNDGSNYDHGFQIQRTTPDQIGYTWHHDFHIEAFNQRLAHRYITYIFYMNDVEEGGETEFWEGTKIQPKTGRLLLFSSDWHHTHRGCRPISNTKYIVTGWTYKYC